MFERFTELSLREALHLGHRYIGSGHLLLGLISQRDPAATGILGPDLDQLRARVLQELADHPEDEDDFSRAPRPDPRNLRSVTLRWHPTIPALLDRIEERLTAIEQHLGFAGQAADPGDTEGRENVVPPS